MSKGVCVGGEGGSEGVVSQRVRRFCLIFRLLLVLKKLLSQTFKGRRGRGSENQLLQSGICGHL